MDFMSLDYRLGYWHKKLAKAKDRMYSAANEVREIQAQINFLEHLKRSRK